MSTGGHFSQQIVVKNLEVKPRKLPFESEDARRLNEVGLMFKQLKIPTWQRFFFFNSLTSLIFFALLYFRKPNPPISYKSQRKNDGKVSILQQLKKVVE